VRITAALLFVALAAGCGGDGDESAGTTTAGTTTTEEPEQDAGEFMKELYEQRLRGQYGREWETLHPAQQKIVTRNRYDACGRQSDNGAGTRIETEVVDTYEEPVLVKGSGTVNSTAVTLRFTYNNPLTGKQAEEHQTLHAVQVGGEWKWILSPAGYDSYAKGNCPE
jgi:hypothetical protein